VPYILPKDTSSEAHTEKRQKTERTQRNLSAETYISRHFAWCAWKSAFHYPHNDGISREHFVQLFSDVFPMAVDDKYRPRTPERATIQSTQKMKTLFPHLCNSDEVLPLPARRPLPTFRAEIRAPNSVASLSDSERKTLELFVCQSNGSWDPSKTKGALVEFFNRALTSCKAKVCVLNHHDISNVL
jgi:hypothetical protein